jgi:protein dithiol oxidoreductase (disulfide-forming)
VNRRNFSSRLLAASAVSLTYSAFAQSTAIPAEGKQFARLNPPVPSSLSAGKIEVLEFFSYGCGHCSAFEPSVEAWAQKLPADVVFQRVPVPFLMNAENFMHTYYALDTLGQVSAFQRKVFAAVHVDRLALDKPVDIAAFMGKNGLDSGKFLAAFNSFSVTNSVNRAKKMAASYKLEGVPAVIVQGLYSTSPGQAGGHDKALAVVDYLIQRARKT